jgi:hypothetical protein
LEFGEKFVIIDADIDRKRSGMEGKSIIEKKRREGKKVIIKRGSYYREKFGEGGKFLIITGSLYTIVFSVDNNLLYAYRVLLRPYQIYCCIYKLRSIDCV